MAFIEGASTRKFRNIFKLIPGTSKIYSIYSYINHYIRFMCFQMSGRTHYNCKHYNKTLSNSLAEKDYKSDISDHLDTIFYFATILKPRLMVELGTRGGESTRSLLAAASLTQSKLLSIDIEDCSSIRVPFRENWYFIKADDVEFGKSGFTDWCLAHSFMPLIDLLFIDTSHEYRHTKEEIAVWSNYLSDRGVMIFHDTNMGMGMYGRLDGSVGFGWNNNRGVIRALEEFVNRRYDEHSYFCDVTDGFNLIHYPNCNGLTVLVKKSD